MAVVVVWAAAGRPIAAVLVAAVVPTVLAQVAEQDVREVVVQVKVGTRQAAVVVQVAMVKTHHHKVELVMVA